MPSITLISDTHGLHHQLQIPKTDWLVHAGDFSNRGRKEEIEEFLEWFAAQPHEVKIFTGGNHDFFLEREPDKFRNMIPKGLIYLENEGCEIEGIKVWGSPITPYFFNWAFNRHRGPEIATYWQNIPPDLDLLITHGPPLGIRDCTNRGDMVGCEALLKAVKSKRPRYHLFGHIHEAYGIEQHRDTTFINAALLDAHYFVRNAPIVIDL